MGLFSKLKKMHNKTIGGKLVNKTVGGKLTNKLIGNDTKKKPSTSSPGMAESEGARGLRGKGLGIKTGGGLKPRKAGIESPSVRTGGGLPATPAARMSRLGGKSFNSKVGRTPTRTR